MSDISMIETGEKRSTRTLGAAVLVGTAAVLAAGAFVLGLVTVVAALSGDLTSEVPVRIGTAAPGFRDQVTPCIDGTFADPTQEDLGCGPSATSQQWPAGWSFPATHATGSGGTDDLVMSTSGEPLVRFEGAAGLWAALIGGGAAGLVLIPVLRRVAGGGPVPARPERRLVLAAVIVAAAWIVATTGPYLAARRVVDLAEHPDLAPGVYNPALPDGWLVADLRPAWWPVLVVAMLVVPALAVRAGRRLAAQDEGLV